VLIDEEHCGYIRALGGPTRQAKRFANCMDTSGITADNPICEPVEDIAEEAVPMLSRTPAGYIGQVEFSYQFLDRIGRSTLSLDGTRVLKVRSPSVA
jgi:hypothetical protein